VRIPHDFAVRKYPIAPSLILAVPLQSKARLAASQPRFRRTPHSREKKKVPPDMPVNPPFWFLGPDAFVGTLKNIFSGIYSIQNFKTKNHLYHYIF